MAIENVQAYLDLVDEKCAEILERSHNLTENIEATQVLLMQVTQGSSQEEVGAANVALGAAISRQAEMGGYVTECKKLVLAYKARL